MFCDRPFKSLDLELVADSTAAPEDLNLLGTPERVASVADTPVREILIELHMLQLPDAMPIPVLAMPRQIAEKLHACTEPGAEDRGKSRLTDVYDLLLLLRLAEATGLNDDVTASCTAAFAERGTHPWPPRVRARAGWEAEWQRLAVDQPFAALSIPHELAAAVALLNSAVDRLSRAM